MSLEVGELCYFLCTKRSWTLGTIEKWDGKKGSCKAREGGDLVANLKEDAIMIMREELLDEDVNDLLHLTLLHDSTILNVLKRRYMRDVIYTNIGAIVVALNPFNFKIPHYMDDQMPSYLAEGDRIEKNLPHSWAVAHNTYWEMMNDAYNQCILVSGESGAGKTEASKIVMKYLAALSCREGSEEQKAAAQAVGTKINKASPPLESFGNAKTSRNDNSSRFGKFMKVKFCDQGFLVGAHITKYLLEKSRIVTASPGERVYHSFYLVLRSGRSCSTFSLADQKEYRSVSAGKTWDNKEFNSEPEFEEVWEAMGTIGMSPGETEGIWGVVGGALHMLNIDFDADGEGSVVAAKTMDALDKGLGIFKVDKEIAKKELVSTEMDIGGQRITKLLPPVKAVDGRDAWIKALYDCAFGWLVEKCNAMLDRDQGGYWVGLLDIFGFEDFELNSFEQLCINLANETLQGHYNQYIFKRDMDECRAEGVDVADVEFPDNTPCLKMQVGKGGLFDMLDEECSLGKGSDESFLDKIADRHKPNPFFLKKQLAKSSFIIHHYAGSVSYEVANFLEKNRDSLKDSIKNLMRASEVPFMQELLPAPVAKTGKALTVGAYFKLQLKALMDLINSTNPHWIRCVKPHPAKKPLMVCGVSTMSQLASAGVLGTVKIRKAGFPVRIPFEEFVKRYGIVSDVKLPQDPVAASAEIIAQSGIDPKRAQAGKTRAFLKSDAYVDLEQLKKTKLQQRAKTTQAMARHYLAMKRLNDRIYEKNKVIIDAMRAAIKSLFALGKEETRARVMIEMEEDVFDGMVVEFHKQSRIIDHDRIVALEKKFYAEQAQARQDIFDEWILGATPIREDEEEERAPMWALFEEEYAIALHEQDVRVKREAKEAAARANQARIEERKAKEEAIKRAKLAKMNKIKEQAELAKARAEKAEENRLKEMRKRREQILRKEVTAVLKEEKSLMVQQEQVRLGGGLVLTQAQAEERERQEWKKMEALRRKKMLTTYTRQTWEEMKAADAEGERDEIMRERREKAAAAQAVRMQRVQDAKEAEAKKERIRQEEMAIAREVDKIRQRETKFTSKLVKEREELRRKAEQRDWELLQQYFAGQAERDSWEKKRAAEKFSQRRTDRMKAQNANAEKHSKENFVPLCQRLGAPDPFTMTGGNMTLSPRPVVSPGVVKPTTPGTRSPGMGVSGSGTPGARGKMMRQAATPATPPSL